MPNDYFAKQALSRFTSARAEDLNAIQDALKTGFDLLPPTAELYQDRVAFGTDSGAADAYVVTLGHNVTYTDGLKIRFTPAHASTGAAATINVADPGTPAGHGLKAAKRFDGSPLKANDLLLHQPAEFQYVAALDQLLMVSQHGATETNAGASAQAAALSAQAALASQTAAAASAAALSGTSATAIAIGAGTFNNVSLGAGKQIVVGEFIILASRANTANYIMPQVTAYDPNSGLATLVVGAAGVGGTGTHADWNWGPSGNPGPVGAQGVTGGGVSEDYTFDTGTTNANPGSGKLRVNASPQSAATAIYVSTTDINGVDMTGLLDSLGASSSTVKGALRVVNKTDPTKWETLNLLGVIPHTGYRELTVVETASSSANPFGASDGISLLFTRTGDAGTAANTATLLNASGVTLLANAKYGADSSGGPISNTALPASHALGDTVEVGDETGFCAQNPVTFTTSDLINGAAGPFVLNVKDGKVVFTWRAGSTGWRTKV